jgi:hypothetical protein
MGKFVHRIVKNKEVEAIQFLGNNLEEIWEVFGEDGIYGIYWNGGNLPIHLNVLRFDGTTQQAYANYWLVADGIPGTFSVYSPSEFEHLYVPKKITTIKSPRRGVFDPEIDGPTRKSQCTIPNCRDHDDEEDDEMTMSPIDNPSTHSVVLSVQTNTPVGWTLAFEQLSRLAADLGVDYPAVNVSSYLVGTGQDEDDLYEKELIYDENTLNKALKALAVKGYVPSVALDIINGLLGAGILIRERR